MLDGEQDSSARKKKGKKQDLTPKKEARPDPEKCDNTQVERWFGHISEKAIRRGSFRSTKELVAKIEDFVARYNEHARPFIWTATADSILKKVEKICKLIDGTGY